MARPEAAGAWVEEDVGLGTVPKLTENTQTEELTLVGLGVCCEPCGFARGLFLSGRATMAWIKPNGAASQMWAALGLPYVTDVTQPPPPPIKYG